MTTPALSPSARPWVVRPRSVRSVVRALLPAAALLLGGQLVYAYADPVEDWVAGLGWLLGVLASIRWPLLLVVLALTALHYLAAGLAARAASGLRLPVREVSVVQLAAAAANRLTPFGAGGTAVNARYFTRRGLRPGQAAASLGSLHLLGGAADLATLALLVLLGGWFGMGGTTTALASLVERLGAIGSVVRSPWTWVATAAVGLLLLAVPRVRRAVLPGSSAWQPVGALVRHPGRLGTLLVSSATTTFVLAVAYVASLAMIGGLPSGVSAGALLVTFFVAGAAASAVPVPSGILATEAALILAAVAAGVPARQATVAVIAFRVVTFWLPAAVGLLTLRPLRRRGAL